MKLKKLSCIILSATVITTTLINNPVSAFAETTSNYIEVNSTERISIEPFKSYILNKTFNGTTDFNDVSTDVEAVKGLMQGGIAARFKSSGTGEQIIFSITDSADAQSHLLVKLTGGKLRFEVKEAGIQKLGFTWNGVNLADGKEHIVLVNSGERGTELYIDGLKVYSTADYRDFFSKVNTPNTMNIGRIVNSGSPQGTAYFNGHISYVNIYNSELSQKDAMAITTLSEIEAPKPEDYNRLINLLNSDEEFNMVFTGDSITHGPLHTKGYRSYSEHLNERLRGEKINGRIKSESFVINTGVSSAKSADILNNFDEVIGKHNPKVVSVMIGMNDTVGVTLEEYKGNLKEIVKKIRTIGAIPILQTNNITNGSRENVADYMEKMREVAKEDGVILIDHFKYWQQQYSLDSTIKTKWLNDAIHPNEIGHLQMTKLIMKELQLDSKDSFTNNLTYPLSTAGAFVDDSSVYPYPEYKGVEEKTPLLSYKVDKEFYQTNYIDKTSDLNNIKDLSKGTIVARFNLTTGALAQTLISVSDSKDQSSNATLAINGGKIHFEVRENGNFTVNETTESGGYNDGKWHTVVLTSDDTGTKIFIDGVLALNSESKGFFNIVQTPDAMNIGRNVHESGKGEWYYNGAISYVDVYDTILTNEEAIAVTNENGQSTGTAINLDRVKNVISTNESGAWVFLGDEDVASKGDTYGYKNFVEYFEERVRWDLNGGSMVKRRKFMINTGVDGATSTDIVANFDKWATEFEPKVVSVMIGGREVVSVEEFESNLREIINKIESINAVPFLQTPVIKNSNIEPYIEIIRKVAIEKNVALIDHYDYWSKLEASQPQVRESWLTENSEPNHRGHLKIAQKMLVDLGIAGGTVTGFNIPYTETSISTLKDELKLELNKAKELEGNSVVGDEPGQYPQYAMDRLQVAIDFAQNEIDRTNSTLNIVNSRIKELTEAINSFKDSINPEVNENIYDVNNDGVIDIKDCALIGQHYGKDKQSSDWKEVSKYDVNNDGVINDEDLAVVYDKIFGI